MASNRHLGTLFGALSLLVLASCVDTGVTSPDVDTAPSFAISDGSSGGNDDFYFLPPIASGNPNPQGDFNPFLLPEMQVCVIGAMDLGPDPSKSCAGRTIVVERGSLDLTVDEVNEQYFISWDTNGPETDLSAFTTDDFLLLEIVIGTEVMGWIDLDPQDPNGPGQSDADAYAFRLGETIPVKFWLSTNVLCDPSDFVLECITGAVVDQAGADLALEGAGNKLGVIIAQNSLPTSSGGIITVTLERIDPALYLAATGGECIPGVGGVGSFDAPQFEDCFRITTNPVLTDPLTAPAVVSICLDPASVQGIDLTQDQQDQLTMVRYNSNGPVWQALNDAGGDCPAQTASLLDVPDDGLFRHVAKGINAVAAFLGPQPVVASDLRLGGLTTSFSNFRYALPGEMIATAGDGTVIQASDDGDVDVTVSVLDYAGVAVAGATVHFSTTDGSVSAASGVSDAAGEVMVTWTVDRTTAGDKTLTASALGLTVGEAVDHDAEDPIFFTAENLDITATVVGPPASLGQVPSENIDDAVAGEPQTLSVTVFDEFGNPVVGAEVGWTCSDQCDIAATSTTDADGVATVQWTPFTSGSQASVATINGVAPTVCASDPTDANCATFTATVAPGTPANLNPTATATSGYVGGTIGLGITLTDTWDNPVGGSAVSWTIGSGAGSFSSRDLTTSATGTAGASWTLGATAGANTATVAAGGLSYTFNATAVCFDGWGTATVNGDFGSAEWACARSMTFQANITGGKAPATVYWMNDANNLYMAVRVQQGSSAKVNDLRIDFDNNGDLAAAVGDDAIGLKSGAAIDEWLNQRCFDRSQSGCGTTDQTLDVVARVANNGTMTTFEISHPLGGDAAGQDFVRSSAAGQNTLGFFLSLQQGNGAQGNTQWPGFRVYHPITIVGLPTP